MAQSHFDSWVAAHYRQLWPELFRPNVVHSTAAFLYALSHDSAALEFGIGTGRIALTLRERGVDVEGIELSAAMVEQLRAAPNGAQIPVAVGDFASTVVGRDFGLVYLLRNTITNLVTQREQVACFRNAARHLRPGGVFLVENYVPNLIRLSPGENTHVFMSTPEHIGIEEYDVENQIAVSRHWWLFDGELVTFESPHRYVWPAELDLMAQLAGMHLVGRWANWNREPFTGDSQQHISVWRKPDSASWSCN